MRVTAMAKQQPSRDRFDLRCDPVWLARVEKQAERFGMSVAAYMKRAITVQLEQDEKTDPRSEGNCGS
jgi:predicted HicB family RNase H-like nuclease